MTTIARERPVKFNLPRRLMRLEDVAYNLWWVWHPEVQRLFRSVDELLWEHARHNPVVFLRDVDPARLEAKTNDRYFLDRYDRVIRDFDGYMKENDTWFSNTYPALHEELIGYFSFEFGLHESLMVYAGGLGVLSGDHLKEASDLGIPLVAVGFLYTYGYFSQRISEDGWQSAENVPIDFDALPLVHLLDEDGKPIKISIDLPGRTVFASVYELNVGRVKLYLLNTNLDDNSHSDRQLTDKLYISDLELRISQEILLGMGGVRALRALGYAPTAWHMNEGHSAFLTLERALEYIRKGMTFAEAAELINKTNIFTTHTPVPAGNDEFPLWLMDKYFSHVWPELGLSRDEFIDIAKITQSWGGEAFSMPVLALKLSEFSNGVSELHGQVSREMWRFLWPDKKEAEIPISHITNGIHTQTWLARRIGTLFSQYMGPDWAEHIYDLNFWNKVESIPDEDLWLVHRHLKRKLVAYLISRSRKRWTGNNIHPVQTLASGVLLDPYALTIGFARRFATYKRANLIFHDYDRLLKIVNNPHMPVQFIFAGKAHPADEPGKLLIQEVYRAVKDARFGGRLAFIEDYDMNIARYLTQGVDVWLNTPRRTREASGTSGMKAALNGVLNFSILDGWWREGYNGHNGWAIGEDKAQFEDQAAQDEADALSLYETLENEIIPLYYEKRSADNLPADWIAWMKESIRSLGGQFSMCRMVTEYMTQVYEPAIRNGIDERNGDL
ncbi:MAG: glycosyltransferase family 1 protein [Chloroflexi bacterium]|nr:glycosyltransferase family 1 protein [Chloroflexota bacterium]